MWVYCEVLELGSQKNMNQGIKLLSLKFCLTTRNKNAIFDICIFLVNQSIE